MSLKNKMLSLIAGVASVCVVGSAQAETNAEVVMYVMDTSGSMSTHMSQQNKDRWAFAVQLARANAKNLSSANGISGDHVYLQFMEFKGHNNIKLSNMVPLHEYSEEDFDYVLTDFFNAEYQLLAAVTPSGVTALADALCTSFDIMDRMTNDQLVQQLTVNAGYQIPADLNIIDREVNFFSDLGDNDSRRCDVVENPSPSQDPWQSVIDYASYIKSGYDDGSKEGKFQFHKYMFTNNPFKTQAMALVSTQAVGTIEAMHQLTDILDGYIHIIPDNQELYLHSGQEHCVDHGVYMCFD